jgi:hypothetical protein
MRSITQEGGIEHELTVIYDFVDEFLKRRPDLADWRQSNNRCPAFTDAEVITMALMQGCLGVSTLKDAYRIIAENFRYLFPHLCTYERWIVRLHQLTPLIGHLIRAVLKDAELWDTLYLMDSKPIPMCKPVRHGRVRLLSDEGAAFGKNSIGWFYGFKLHLVVHYTGAILTAILTPGNWNDRDPGLALAWSLGGGVVLADLGYPGEEFEQTLFEEADLLLMTPKHAGEKGEDRRTLLSSLRERVETTFSSLSRRFVDRVLSRSWNGLWNTIKLKLIHFNLCQAGLLSV